MGFAIYFLLQKHEHKDRSEFRLHINCSCELSSLNNGRRLGRYRVRPLKILLRTLFRAEKFAEASDRNFVGKLFEELAEQLAEMSKYNFFATRPAKHAEGRFEQFENLLDNPAVELFQGLAQYFGDNVADMPLEHNFINTHSERLGVSFFDIEVVDMEVVNILAGHHRTRRLDAHLQSQYMPSGIAYLVARNPCCLKKRAFVALESPVYSRLQFHGSRFKHGAR